MRPFPFLLVLLALLASPVETLAEGPVSPLFGRWLTEDGKSQVEIAPCAHVVCGTVVWLEEPLRDDGRPIVDSNNDDPALRDRKVMGLRIMDGFRLNGPGQLEDGTIYNPEDGNTYEPTFTLQDDGSLELEACILFICQSQNWVRVE